MGNLAGTYVYIPSVRSRIMPPVSWLACTCQARDVGPFYAHPSRSAPQPPLPYCGTLGELDQECNFQDGG